MKKSLHRCIVAPLHGFHASVPPGRPARHFCRALILGALLSPLFARGQSFALEKIFARSISGQFIVRGAPQFSLLAGSPGVANDTNFVRLEPALLAVSAERIKDALRRRLEIRPDTAWRGQIFLMIHPAQSLDEDVTIISTRQTGGWDYRVELPDVLSRTRFMRALTGVLLLELANRDAQSHSAEIPAWLVDGLAQQMLAAGAPEFILSSPDKMVNGLPVVHINATHRGLDLPNAAQAVLKVHPALTFEQLSWPDGTQLAGDDGGVYRASAQVFVGSLLELKDGPAQVCAMLASLPQFYNWQLAFQSAFRADFPRPLDVEKWWALQVAGFAVRDPGPLWTPAASRARLDALLSVPVETRDASNSLPAHAEISLQTAIRSLDADRQAVILQAKWRDLGLAQLRMTPPFAALAGEYRRALAGYLGEQAAVTTAAARPGHTVVISQKVSVGRTLRKLDELDARRLKLEAAVGPEMSVPPTPARLEF
jgi:hypothetical protein